MAALVTLRLVVSWLAVLLLVRIAAGQTGSGAGTGSDMPCCTVTTTTLPDPATTNSDNDTVANSNPTTTGSSTITNSTTGAVTMTLAEQRTTSPGPGPTIAPTGPTPRPVTSPKPGPSGPEPDEQLQNRVDASMSFLFVAGNLSVVKTSRWMANFRRVITMVWQQYLYHGADAKASDVGNNSTVLLLLPAPALHTSRPANDQCSQCNCTFELSFYVSFNNSPITNDQLPILLNYVTPIRRLIQTSLNVSIDSVLTNVSDLVYMSVLGRSRPGTGGSTPADVDVSARINRDYLRFELPAGVSIVAAAFIVGITVCVCRRYRPDRQTPFPSTNSRAAQRSKLYAIDGSGDAYDVGFVYPGPAVSIIRDNPYNSDGTLAATAVAEPAAAVADDNHAIVVSTTGGGTARDSAIELTVESAAPVPAPRAVDVSRSLQHPPNTTPL